MITSIDKEAVGIRAKQTRLDLGLTQEGADELLGWGQPAISTFETGKVVTAAKCIDISKAYGISLDKLLFGVECANGDAIIRPCSIEEEIESMEFLINFLQHEKLPFLRKMKRRETFTLLDEVDELLVVEGPMHVLQRFLQEQCPPSSIEDLDNLLLWPTADTRITSFIPL